MNLNFRDASERHLGDGELLLDEDRSANADYLFGISAECSLKAIMERLGMATSRVGSPKDPGHKVHMPALWAAFQSFAGGRLAPRYIEPLDAENPFADWKVDQRYWKRTAIGGRAAANHRNAAIQCQVSLGKIVLDGVTR